ncbi:MAG: extensin family protein [Pseudomonadota bacterium]
MARRAAEPRRIPFVPNTLKLFLLLVAIAAFIIVFRHGYVPTRYAPFAAVSLDEPSGFFLDWRIAQLADDRDACRRLFDAPQMSVRPVADRGTRPGCGWTNAFRVAEAGRVAIRPAMTMECPLGAALSLWLEHGVQPAAKKHFGARVTAIRNVGGYSCRTIRGGLGKYFSIRSEHARANAIDIVGFRLSNGRTVSVLRGWPRADQPEGRFLRAVHAAACRYFRVTLGPEANALHRDHFHLDRGPLMSCR